MIAPPAAEVTRLRYFLSWTALQRRRPAAPAVPIRSDAPARSPAHAPVGPNSGSRRQCAWRVL